MLKNIAIPIFCKFVKPEKGKQFTLHQIFKFSVFQYEFNFSTTQWK